MSRKDWPGHDLKRTELHKRLFASYQLAGRLLMDPLTDSEEARNEMTIVLLDFLSDPNTADVDRISFASRGFVDFPKAVKPSPEVVSVMHTAGVTCSFAACQTCARAS